MLHRSRTVTRGIGSQAFVQLSVSDVEGDHVGRAALEEAVGESARRGAGVEGATPRTSMANADSA